MFLKTANFYCGLTVNAKFEDFLRTHTQTIRMITFLVYIFPLSLIDGR